MLDNISSCVRLDQELCNVESRVLHAESLTAYWYKRSLHQCCIKTLVTVSLYKWSAMQLSGCSQQRACSLHDDPTLVLQMKTLLMTVHCP